MKQIITKSALFGVLLMALPATAQQEPRAFGQLVHVNPENNHIRCISTEYENYLQQKNPNRATSAGFEQWLAPKVEQVKQQRKAAKSTGAAATIINIPVVVHVVSNGDAIGSDENISDEQVLSQITVLNQDYRKMLNTPGYNDNPVGADMEIEFHLATVDPDGNPTTGIDRVTKTNTSWNSESTIESNLKPGTIWNPDAYFNLWVVKFGGNMEGILGYSQFPSESNLNGLNDNMGDADTDGVVIGYEYFGSSDIDASGDYYAPYDMGRTASHEIGHFFGLLHTWGDLGSRTNNQLNCAGTDYCDDTPVTGWENYDCSSVQNSCTSYAGNDMVENYMDYTNDACMNTFTEDQKSRVMAVLQNSPRRASLTTSNVWQGVAGTQSFALNSTVLYPNPAQNVLNIQMANNELPDSFAIYNSLGQTVASVKVSDAAALTVNTSAYSNGIYFVKLVKGSQSKTLKFIKQ